MKGYIGTYASTQTNGIYEFIFDEQSKKFKSHKLFQNDQDAKYLSMNHGVLAYPLASSDGAIKMIQNEHSYMAGKEEHVSCYITQDDDFIYTANYHDGVVSRYHKEDQGFGICETIQIKKNAGTHQVILKDDVLFVPCRNLDCVYVYDRKTLDEIDCISFPKDSGPRHGVLDQKEEHMYLISENTCEVFCLSFQDGYQIEKVLPLLEGQQVGGGAAIRMSEDNRFLYISVRELNLLYVVDIATWRIIQVLASGGNHPRDIALDPSQQFLFVANRFSNNLVVFERDKQSGHIQPIAQLDHIIEGVSIVFEGGK